MAVLAGREPCGSSGHAPQARGRQEQGGRRHYGEKWQRRDPSQLPNPVFFHSDELVVYCSAMAARFSTGLICHPIKTGQRWYTAEWESVSLLCSSKDGGDKKKGSDRQIRGKTEHL